MNDFFKKYLPLLFGYIIGAVFVIIIVLTNGINEKEIIKEVPAVCEQETIVIENTINPYKDKENMMAFIQSQNVKVYEKLAENIVEGIFQASEKYDLPPTVLLSLINVESSFRYDAVSSLGAIGLTQIYPPVWVDDKDNKYNLVTLGIIKKKKDLYDPIKNIHAGAFVLKHYLDEAIGKNDDNPLKFALTRYFGGKVNEHYTKMRLSMADYVIFTKRKNGEMSTKLGKPIQVSENILVLNDQSKKFIQSKNNCLHVNRNLI